MSVKFPEERYMKILLGMRLTEKSNSIGINRQYVFRVIRDAAKPEIKRAVELMFNVKVDGVQVSNVKGKVKRVGRITGRQRNWKKAYVKLAEGQKIDISHA